MNIFGFNISFEFFYDSSVYKGANQLFSLFLKPFFENISYYFSIAAANTKNLVGRVIGNCFPINPFFSNIQQYFNPQEPHELPLAIESQDLPFILVPLLSEEELNDRGDRFKEAIRLKNNSLVLQMLQEPLRARDRTTGISLAMEAKNEDLAETIAKSEEPLELQGKGLALCMAINLSYEKVVDAILARGEVPNEYRLSATRLAAARCSIPILQKIFDNGPLTQEFIDLALQASEEDPTIVEFLNPYI